MIPLPIADENPTARRPVVTKTLILLNVAVWIFQLVHQVQASVLDYGVIPAWVLHGMREGRLVLPNGSIVGWHQEVPHPFTLLTSMFMHGGWLHIIGNMWFLWIFGDNVEDRLGRVRFAIFYLVCGVAAAMGQVLVTPDSTVPMVGASGAIAGVLGAYLMLYPRAWIRCLWVLLIFITHVRLPAWVLLGLWFLSQFLLPAPGVAWVAHAAGFIVGLALVRLAAPSTKAL